MDDIDRQLLNIIQANFPVVPHPYQVLGDELGITEKEAMDRVGKLIDQGIIRKIGPSFETRKLGHISTLVAARVPSEMLEEVAAAVSAFPEVTHNYGRDFTYNLWFTLVCESPEHLDRTISEIKEKTGVADIHSMPAEKLFKIKVEFEF